MTKANITCLKTAEEISEMYGKTYFYRQRIYRLFNKGLLPAYGKDPLLFNPGDVRKVFERQLRTRVRDIVGRELNLTIHVNPKKKEIVVSGIRLGTEGRARYWEVEADTQDETEAALIAKILGKLGLIGKMKTYWANFRKQNSLLRRDFE